MGLAVHLVREVSVDASALPEIARDDVDALHTEIRRRSGTRIMLGHVGQVIVAGDPYGRFLGLAVVVSHDKLLIAVAGDDAYERARQEENTKDRERYQRKHGPDRRRRENRTTA